MVNLVVALVSVMTLSLTEPVTSKKLIFAHVVWRHGSRSTMDAYPNSPYQDSYWTPGPHGELIAQGMAEHVTLAGKFRQRYVVETKLVSPRYRADEIHVRSSDYNRTIVSAMSHMAAFYFAAGIPGIDYPYSYNWPGLWTPVPVHTVPWDNDTLLNMVACPRANDLYNLAKQTPEFQEFSAISRTVLEYLTNHSGQVVDTVKDAFSVCDAVIMEDNDNLAQTPWQKLVLTPCKELFAEYFNFWFGWNAAPYKGHNFRIELPQAIGGKLLFEIITRMQQKYENYLDNSKHPWISNLRYYAYSGHDSVLATMAALFEFEHIDYNRNLNPTTANAYSVELWINDDNQPLIKVLYWRREDVSFIDVSKKIGGCKFTTEGCNLDHFVARSMKYKPPDDFDQFCHSRLPELNS